MADHSTNMDWAASMVVCVTQPVVAWATRVNGHGTQRLDICQARNPINAMIVTEEGSAGGICDAASGEWIKSKWDDTTADPTDGLVAGADFSADTVRGLMAIQNHQTDSLKTLTSQFLSEPHNGMTSNAEIADLIITDHAVFGDEFSVLLGMNFRMGMEGGHSTAAHRHGDVVDYFDINYGLYRIECRHFANWFWWYMKATGYDVAFGTVNETLLKPRSRI